MRVRMSGGVVRFGLPGVVLGLLLSWLSGAKAPHAAAQTRAGGAAVVPQRLAVRPGRVPPGRALAMGEANGTLALITSPMGTAQWMYLIDTKTQAFAVYRVDPSNPTKGIVKLEAARQYQWDLKLEHYNNQAPEPAAIEAMVKTLAQTAR